MALVFLKFVCDAECKARRTGVDSSVARNMYLFAVMPIKNNRELLMVVEVRGKAMNPSLPHPFSFRLPSFGGEDIWRISLIFRLHPVAGEDDRVART